VRTIDDVLTWVYDEIDAWLQASFRCLDLAVSRLGRLPGRATGIM